MTENTREMLNRTYQPLIGKLHELVATLARVQEGTKVTSGFYNGHYHKNASGEYQEDIYPIPVISVTGLCDIEIDFDGISVTAKLSKESILLFDWNLLGDIPFEVYGVEQYLTDYGNSQNMDEMSDMIPMSAEKEFFVSLSFPITVREDEVCKTIEALQKNHFYY